MQSSTHRIWTASEAGRGEEDESRDKSETKANLLLLSSVGLYGQGERNITYSSE